MAAPIIQTPSGAVPDGAYAEWFESFDGARLRLLHFGGEGARGKALLIPGWTEPAEKYTETALDLIDRGFAVSCLDPRGQGLSQRLKEDDGRGRIDDFQKHVRDLQAVTDHLGTDNLLLLGHSLGGLVCLHYLAQGGSARCALLSAPATRIFPHAAQRLGVRLLARLMCMAGFQDQPLSQPGGMAMEFEGNTLTHDRARHSVLRDLLLTDDRLALPRTSPAMVGALHKAQRELMAKGKLEAINIPTLIVSVKTDEWVVGRHHRDIAARNPVISLAEVAGARHEILMEEDQYRDQFFDAADLHLDRHMPRPAAEGAP